MPEVITSGKNALVRFLLSLQKKKNRDKEKKFLVEGFRENKVALQFGWKCEMMVFPTGKLTWQEICNQLEAGTNDLISQPVSAEVFEKLAYRGRVDNVVGVYESPELGLKEFKVENDPIVLVLDKLEKPGNIGAIMRTADAAGIHSLILCDTPTDVLNPNTVRASLGTLFSLNVLEGGKEEIYKWLKEQGFRIVTSYLHKGIPHFEASYDGRTAIIMGSEADGVDEFWVTHSDELVTIPMRGIADSMNVSTATAVIVNEALRQRTGGANKNGL